MGFHHHFWSFKAKFGTAPDMFAGVAYDAARMVLQLAVGEAVEPARVELATQLVVRASTAPPRLRP